MHNAMTGTNTIGVAPQQQQHDLQQQSAVCHIEPGHTHTRNECFFVSALSCMQCQAV